MIQKTIVALATPPLQSAIALVRVSGPKSHSILLSLFSTKITSADERKVKLGIWKTSQGEKIDQVMVTYFVAPRSYTGEDMIEISCHGSMFIVQRIIASCLSEGAVLAEQGEYTQRAYLNGKLDLVQAESVHDLVVAQSAASHQLALTNLGGKASSTVHQIKLALQDIRAHIEVNIDYPEYHDIEQITHDLILPRLLEVERQMSTILSDAKIGKVISQGLKTAIVGQANVGKSSLLNALLNENKAIVTEIAGTTRDVVEGSLQLGGITLHLMDTAGIRSTQDKVEAIGISKSLEVLERADIVLVVLDATRPLDKDDRKILELSKDKSRIIISNKTDLSTKYVYPNSISISALNKQIDDLEKALYDLIGFNPKEVLNRPLLTNARQEGLMASSYQSVIQLISATRDNTPLDLLSVDLAVAINSIQALLGEIPNDQLDQEIFSRFCIGK